MPEVAGSRISVPRTRRYVIGLAVAFGISLALIVVGIATDARLTLTIGAALATSCVISALVRLVRSGV